MVTFRGWWVGPEDRATEAEPLGHQAPGVTVKNMAVGENPYKKIQMV